MILYLRISTSSTTFWTCVNFYCFDRFTCWYRWIIEICQKGYWNLRFMIYSALKQFLILKLRSTYSNNWFLCRWWTVRIIFNLNSIHVRGIRYSTIASIFNSFELHFLDSWNSVFAWNHRIINSDQNVLLINSGRTMISYFWPSFFLNLNLFLLTKLFIFISKLL